MLKLKIKTLKRHPFATCSDVSIGDFKQVNISWESRDSFHEHLNPCDI